MPPVKKNVAGTAPGATEANTSAPPASPAPTAATSPPPAVAPPPATQPPARPRRVAICTKTCAVALGAGVQRIYGGDWIIEPSHVAVIEHDVEHFRMLDFPSAAAMTTARASFDAHVADLRRRAADIGLVLFRDGEVDPPKRRR